MGRSKRETERLELASVLGIGAELIVPRASAARLMKLSPATLKRFDKDGPAYYKRNLGKAGGTAWYRTDWLEFEIRARRGELVSEKFPAGPQVWPAEQQRLQMAEMVRRTDEWLASKLYQSAHNYLRFGGVRAQSIWRRAFEGHRDKWGGLVESMASPAPSDDALRMAEDILGCALSRESDWSYGACSLAADVLKRFLATEALWAVGNISGLNELSRAFPDSQPQAE